MAELHDYQLDCYAGTVVAQACEFATNHKISNLLSLAATETMPVLEEIKRAIAAGREQLEEKNKAREAKEREEARKAEEGKFDPLVRMLR